MDRQELPTEQGRSWFERLSIRCRIVALTVAILLPVAAILVWFLAGDLQHAHDDAHETVRNLASGTAKELLHRIHHAETVLGRLAERPHIRAIDPDQCDPMVAEYIEFEPQYLALAVSDARGNIVCSYRSRPVAQLTAAQFPWFERALHSGRFQVSDVFIGPVSGTSVIAMTHPIRDDAGRVVGLLILPVDLSILNHELLDSTPDNAIVSVIDQTRTLLLRSRNFNTYVGHRPGQNEPDPALGAREGLVNAIGRDGVSRIFAFETVPGVDWRVTAGLPRASVYAQYNVLLVRILGIGLALAVVSICLAWHLSGAIVRPIADLEQAAARVASGQDSVRAKVGGPPEIRSVARQFNQMLDARALSDARLQGIFETASDAILTVDESQSIVMANPAAAHMFRCPMDQLIGAPLMRFIPERYRTRHVRDLHEFGEGDVSARHMGTQREVMALCADGDEFPIEAAISYLSVGGQRLYTVILRDITERRRAEEALLASTIKMEAAMESMNDAVFVSDAKGRLIDFNDAFRTFHRFTSKAQCMQTLAEYAAVIDLIKADGEPARLDQWAAARALRGETATSVEYKLRRKDTGEVWIGSYSFAPIRAKDGAILGAVVTARDITAIKQAQADLESSRVDLERLLAALDSIQENERKRIARELHDDLQQTLAAIKMDANEIGGQLDADPARIPPLVARITGLASTAMASTRRIINDLRPQMLEELGLVAALEALASQFSQRTGIVCEVEAVGWVAVDGALKSEVATCLYRVAQESLNNVAKHARASRVDVQLTSLTDTGLRLSIRDDGQGMAAGDRRKAQSFGLLGMNERVRAVGGRLRIVSEPGDGTAIDVEIFGAAYPSASKS